MSLKSCNYGTTVRTIEDLEASNEDSKAANEEITSVNEELQSTNEELETSKEEFESSSSFILLFEQIFSENRTSPRYPSAGQAFSGSCSRDRSGPVDAKAPE